MTTATSEQGTVPALDTLTGKRINLTFRPKDKDDNLGDAVTQEGRVEIGSPIGLMFKEKGKSGVQLVEQAQIINIEQLAAKEPNVTVKKLLPVAAGRMRQHLADRHGWTVAVVNDMSEAEAEKQHEGLDHSTLAHKHEQPKAEQDAQAQGPNEGDEPDEGDEADQESEDS